MPIAIEPGAGVPTPRIPASWSAHLHAEDLDRALVQGMPPDATPRLDARARWLTSKTQLRIVAKGLNSSIRRGAIPETRISFTTRMRVSPEAAGDAREALELLARRLLSPDRPAAAGAVLARWLLTDGIGPMYSRIAQPGDLRRAAEHALLACGP